MGEEGEAEAEAAAAAARMRPVSSMTSPARRSRSSLRGVEESSHSRSRLGSSSLRLPELQSVFRDLDDINALMFRSSIESEPREATTTTDVEVDVRASAGEVTVAATAAVAVANS